MQKEHSAGAVIFYQDGLTVEYLLLQYRHFRWDFPHGHIEPGESEQATAMREIEEETGLTKLQFIPGWRMEVAWEYKHWQTGEPMHKTVVYFLAKSTSKNVRLSEEDLDFKWLPLESARALPSFPHVNRVLLKAHEYLSSGKEME